MKRLQDRVAIVTGAGRGIGRATALRLAADGAAVVINDLDGDVAEEVVSQIREAGGRAAAGIGNCAKRADADRVAQVALNEFEKIDIVVNNAGITRDKIFHQLDEAAYDLVLDANLRTTFNMTQAAVTYMREAAKAEIAAGGHPAYHRKIVNTASVVAFTGNPGQWNYTAAKGAVKSATKTLAIELGPFWINVNAVAPGFVETRLTAAHGSASHAETGLGIPQAARDSVQSMISMGYLGRPEDIANVTAFLVSSDADYVSGVTVPITGAQFGGMG